MTPHPSSSAGFSQTPQNLPGAYIKASRAKTFASLTRFSIFEHSFGSWAVSWLVWAARLDAFRVIPRLLLIAYYLFFAKAWFYVVDWFQAYNWAGVTNEAVALALAGFPAAILGVLTGVLAGLTNNYFRTGRSDKGG